MYLYRSSVLYWRWCELVFCGHIFVSMCYVLYGVGVYMCFVGCICISVMIFYNRVDDIIFVILVLTLLQILA